MKSLIYGAAASVALLSISALAEGNITLNPNEITIDAKRPQLQLNDQQRTAIHNGLEIENTEQKTPPQFEPKIDNILPSTMTVDVMPEFLLAQEPSLKQYGYAKIAKDVLVIDPMQKTIIAVLPLKLPTSGKDQTPADWAATRGRELTGQVSQQMTGAPPAMEPAGDSGDKKNGNEASTTEK